MVKYTKAPGSLILSCRYMAATNLTFENIHRHYNSDFYLGGWQLNCQNSLKLKQNTL